MRGRTSDEWREEDRRLTSVAAMARSRSSCRGRGTDSGGACSSMGSESNSLGVALGGRGLFKLLLQCYYGYSNSNVKRALASFPDTTPDSTSCE